MTDGKWPHSTQAWQPQPWQPQPWELRVFWGPRSPDPHPMHSQASSPAQPLLPGSVPGMQSCPSVPVLLWQNSSCLFGVRRLCLVTATVYPDREKARRQEKEENEMSSHFCPIQSHPPNPGPGLRCMIQLGQSGPGPGSPQADSLGVTWAVSLVTPSGPALPSEAVGAGEWCRRFPSLATVMFDFPGPAPLASVILGAGLHAASEGSP